MILCISPAKNLDFESSHARVAATLPEMIDRAQPLVARLREMSPAAIRKLMGVSEPLARLNARRYAQWSLPFAPDNARPCLFAFNGDVYRSLDAPSLGPEDLAFAQKRLRILSGLYGLLRPLDLIQPYRLEMGTRFGVDGAADLYSYWKDAITTGLNEALRAARTRFLVNLASEEYFKAVDAQRIEAKIVRPVFKDRKNGGYSVFFAYAKRARGLMCRYAIEKRLTDPERLKEFDVAGYKFAPRLSTETDWVFTRDRRP